MLYACDELWWQTYHAEAKARCAGECWTIDERARERFDLHWIRGVDAPGLSPGEDRIHTGSNSGYQAMGLAVAFGARRLLLLGFDFKNAGARAHWHNDHPRGMNNGGMYADWIKAMNRLASDLKAREIEVINCSRDTALTCFERRSIECL